MKQKGYFSFDFFFTNRWVFGGVISLLSLVSFWRVVTFGFFQDDYFFLYNGFYDPFVQFINFKHPGAPLEAFLFAPILGYHPALWGLLGIAIRAVCAYLVGIFLYKITKSQLAAFLAATFLAVSSAGLYVVGSFNYHLTALVAIFLLLTFISITQAIQEKEQRWWKIIIPLSISFFLDPARVLPMVIMLPLFVLLILKPKKVFAFNTFVMKILAVFFGIAIPLLIIWFFVFSIGSDSQIAVFLHGMQTDPAHTITKLKEIGNFFATIGNLYTQVVYGLQLIPPKYETGIYARPIALVGIAILLAGIASFIYYLKAKSQTSLILSFFIFWTYIFYVPNWISEPRAPMAAQQHYVFISSIGYICLVAYLVSIIKKKWLILCISICFILLNISKTYAILSLQAPYRSAAPIESGMKSILHTVPNNGKDDIFLFFGDIDWFGNSLSWDLGAHFLLARKNPHPYDMPQPLYDEASALKKICSPTKAFSVYFGTIHYPQIRLSHVFAWYVKSPGILVDITQQERVKLLNEAQQAQCHVLQ